MSLDDSLHGAYGVAPLSVAEAPALRPLSLRRNFAWTLTGSGVYAASQWGMMIVLAKLGSADVVGRFALGLALGAPVVMFTNLQLRAVQATDARHEYTFADYLSLRLIMSAVALGLIAALAVMGGYRAEVADVIVLVGLAKCVESISDVIYGLWQKQERLDLIAISQMLKGPASLVALWVVMRATGSLVGATLGLLAVWTGLLFSYDAFNARRILRLLSWREGRSRKPRPRLPVLRRLAWLAAPLGVVGLLDSLNYNLPRYFLQHSLGEAALGHFAALASLLVAGNMVVMPLAQSAAPRLARYYVTDLAAFTRLVLDLIKFALVIGGVGLLVSLVFGRQLLTILYKTDYAAHAEVLVWVMAGAGIGYLAKFLVCAMTAARRFRAQAPLYALATLACAVVSYATIPRWGLVGAAWGTGAAALVLALGAAGITLQAVRQRACQEELETAPPERP
jgi:O-antigen/teichoic acid export membrane protein